MHEKLAELRARLMEIDDLSSAGALLNWDQSTYMPSGGAAARGRQMATLGKLGHEKATDPAIGHLLDELLPYEASLPPDHDDAALVRVARRGYERLTKVPAELIAEMYAHGAASYQAWTQARPANDVATMLPYLEKRWS